MPPLLGFKHQLLNLRGHCLATRQHQGKRGPSRETFQALQSRPAWGHLHYLALKKNHRKFLLSLNTSRCTFILQHRMWQNNLLVVYRKITVKPRGHLYLVRSHAEIIKQPKLHFCQLKGLPALPALLLEELIVGDKKSTPLQQTHKLLNNVYFRPWVSS